MDNYPVKLNLRIDWSEMDLFGHVNNVAYFKYIQASRVNYWESIGLVRIFEENKIGPILLSASCQFRKPLRYPGNIVIQARMDFIKNTSFGIHHQVLNEQNEIAAEAQDVIVMYDFNKNSKVPFPDGYRRVVEKMENRDFGV
jgi:acyl-CoA thioester hydrolase